MKQILLLAIFLFISVSQGQDLEKELRLYICDCFEKGSVDGNFNIELYKTCLDFSAGEAKPIIEKIIINNADTTNIGDKDPFQIGYEAGVKLFYDIQRPLVKDCNTYYEFIEKMKRVMVSNLKKGIQNENIESLKMNINNDEWSPDIVWLLGAYYLNNGELNKAIDTFNLCITKAPTHLPSNFFLAVSYDLNKDYNSAIEIYRRLAEMPENQITNMARVFLEATLKTKELE